MPALPQRPRNTLRGIAYLFRVYQMKQKTTDYDNKNKNAKAHNVVDNTGIILRRLNDKKLSARARGLAKHRSGGKQRSLRREKL
jgi:hypothetical protein